MKLVLIDKENIKTFTNISHHIELQMVCLGVQHTVIVAHAGQQ